jgi:ribose 5-phosphate isomerase B
MNASNRLNHERGMEEIPIASDHAGIRLKAAFIRTLTDLGYTPLDLGPDSDESVDYPDFGRLVAQKVSNGDSSRGILICGSGIGISIVANKFRGVRAALCYTVESARLSREHNDSNILVCGERAIPESLAIEILKTWLETPFSGGRHQQRVDKISALENDLLRSD